MSGSLKGIIGWKSALILSWIAVLGLLGMTFAELSEYGQVVQFWGNALLFSWQPVSPVNHYRISLIEQDLTADPVTESNFTLYSDTCFVEIEALPGHAYQLSAQAVTASGDTSVSSEGSPCYLCLGTSPSASDQFQADIPVTTTLGAAYPNPFNSVTTIPFMVSSSGGTPVSVSVRIYNTLGQVVRSLLEDELNPGQYRAVWNGKNDHGAVVATGTYICHLQAGEWSGTRLLLLEK